MDKPLSDSQLQRRARQRVGMKLGLATHALVYLLVNTGLVLYSVSQGGRWHWGPLLGWGLGLGIHALVVLANLQGEGLRQRMLADEVQRLRDHH